MVTPIKDTLEREGFWTYEQAIDQDLSDALAEFNAKIAQQTEFLFRGILEREGLIAGGALVKDGLPDEEEIKRRCVMVRRPGPQVAARSLFYREVTETTEAKKDDLYGLNLHGLTDKIGLEEIRNSTFVDDYMLDGKSVLYVVRGFRGNVLTVRFVVVGEKE